jgi:cysteinyl-tRNA synthetase
MKYLGESFDIHAGGIDLQFPHHENEIAQSEGATGKQFAKYWLHGEFLKIDNEKMAKSLGNEYTLRDILSKGFSPIAIRYLLLSVPYGKQLNFTFEGLKGAETAIARIQQFRRLVIEARCKEGFSVNVTVLADRAKKELEEAMDDDLNTSVTLASLHNFIREINSILSDELLLSEDRDKVLDVISRFDSVLGIFGKEIEENLDEEVERLIGERQLARRNRDFARADEIRDELLARGIVLEDTKDGVRWKKS